jgi:hypothetical protein
VPCLPINTHITSCKRSNIHPPSGSFPKPHERRGTEGATRQVTPNTLNWTETSTFLVQCRVPEVTCINQDHGACPGPTLPD